MRQVSRRLQSARQPEHVLTGVQSSLAAKRDCRRRFGGFTEWSRQRELNFVASGEQRERFEITEVVGAIELEDERIRANIGSVLDLDNHPRERAVLIANQHRMNGL